jgi:hypothetical protein
MNGVTDTTNEYGGERCATCGAWIGERGNDARHDREVHKVVALERIAEALSKLLALASEGPESERPT